MAKRGVLCMGTAIVAISSEVGSLLLMIDFLVGLVLCLGGWFRLASIGR